MTSSAMKNHRRDTKQLEIAFGGFSSQGIKDENQDAFVALNPLASAITKGSFVAMADGVSSASHGKQAAQLSVTQACEEYFATPDSWSTQKSLSKVLLSLNNWLCSQANTIIIDETANAEQQGLIRKSQWLTTFSGLILKSATATIFHIGDSRVYQYRNQQLEQLTNDHQASYGLAQQVLTRALGADQHLKVDTQQLPLVNNDIYLLSTDGLHNFLTNKQIKEQLDKLTASSSQHQLEQASQALVELAISSGSNDNVSCLLVYVSQIAAKDSEEVLQEFSTKAIPPVLAAGQQLDNYKIIKALHASPRSHLYLVEDIASNQLSVLKAPSSNFEEDAIYLQGFVREAWVAERISHQNIMQITAANPQSPFLYHLCEHIEGQTLDQWIIDHPKPSLAQVRDLIEQIIQALRVFERLDLVHRDLKPDNIMITTQGQVKLIDYGTVLIPSLVENNDYLHSDTPVGAMNYLAPETLHHLETDHTSDLFSLGVICFELLTGELPFKNLASKTALTATKSQWQYQSIRQYRSDLPLWLDLTLKKATEPNKQNRYQAYSEFWADLSTPNTSLVKAHNNQPLLERDPVKFWQVCTFILFCLLLISVLN